MNSNPNTSKRVQEFIFIRKVNKNFHLLLTFNNNIANQALSKTFRF